MFRVFKVTGDSMVPTLRDKDFVITSRWFLKPKVGQLVAVEHPEYQTIVKRISQINEVDQLLLQGDNPESVSSTRMGWITKDQVLGRVLFCVKQP